jgi:hypothetical protein
MANYTVLTENVRYFLTQAFIEEWIVLASKFPQYLNSCDGDSRRTQEVRQRFNPFLKACIPKSNPKPFY